MAPPRPDLYSQRTTPNGSAQPGVRSVGFGSGIGRSLAQAGQALGDVAQSQVNMQEAELRVEDIQRQREEEDGRAYAAKAIAEYRATANAERRRIFEEAPDGWRGATENTAIRLGELREEVAGRAPTPTARRFVEESIDAYNPLYLDGVAEDEQRQRERYHVDTLGQAIETEASTLVAAPQDYDASIVRTRELISGMQGIGEDARRSLLQSAEQSFANAAIGGMIDRDPRGVLRKLNDPEATGAVAALTASQRAQYIDRANNEIERRNARYRAQVADSASAAMSLWELGLDAPNAPDVNTVRNALGADRAIAYEAARAVSGQIGGLSARPSSELAAMANNATPGTDVRTATIATAQRRAATQILEQRAKDPMQFAVRNRMAEDGGLLAALQGGDWDTFDTALRQRGAAATQNGNQWGTKPNPLTGFEAQALSQTLQRLPSQSRAAFFQRAARSLGPTSPAYRALLDQVAEDNPITAYAGYAQSFTTGGAVVGRDRLTGERAGRLIFRGQELLGGGESGTGAEGRKPVAPIDMPNEDQLRRRWDAETRGAFPTPESSASAYQAYRAAYAALAEEGGAITGDSVDSRIARQAVAAATGGVAEINGRRTILPFMSPQNFLATARLRLGPTVGGYRFEDLEFIPNGANTYAVQVGGQTVFEGNRPVTLTINR